MQRELTIEYTKKTHIKTIILFQIQPNRGYLLVSTPAGLNNFSFYFSIIPDKSLFKEGMCFSRKSKKVPTSLSEHTNITSSIYKCVFIILFPPATAEKNVTNEISKYPQSNPAKSNNGLGILAKARIANHPYFLINFSIIFRILLLA